MNIKELEIKHRTAQENLINWLTANLSQTHLKEFASLHSEYVQLTVQITTDSVMDLFIKKYLTKHDNQSSVVRDNSH